LPENKASFDQIPIKKGSIEPFFDATSVKSTLGLSFNMATSYSSALLSAA
jgi:hypothetical protein